MARGIKARFDQCQGLPLTALRAPNSAKTNSFATSSGSREPFDELR